MTVPVIAIDGGAGTGKSTVAKGVAEELGFQWLNSGIFYRAVGLVCQDKGLIKNFDTITDSKACAETAVNLDIKIDGEKVYLSNKDETQRIFSEEAGKLASLVGKDAGVREGVRPLQLRMRVAPGLVADGRDQSQIFDTPYMFFLEAAPEEKARRRVLQFEKLGTTLKFEDTLQAIIKRDEADKTRDIAPLMPHPKALIIDTTHIDAKQVIEIIVKSFKERITKSASH